MDEKYRYTNRLADQKSPYLLQHAHNPIDWYPWGDDAFVAAQHLDKPIFLSIGYATCHWCHVMERESFENLEIAKLMNDTFINIKVDREELPEIDSLYMEFAQSMMSGTAGWPLNVILTPSLLPFFAATYLPPKNAHGLMGLEELVERIRQVWQGDEREHVIAQSEKILEIFTDAIHYQGDVLPEKESVDDAAEILFKLADPVFGGMLGAPKFPIGYQYLFLLRYFCAKKESRALFFVEKTLDMMHRGGIYDHLGGGFSRYSVDEKWLIPHFEKMLYDNALLADAYLEAWRVTKKNFYKEVCLETLNYILRDMTHSKGGFFSAEDADTEGHEGLFYTWTYDEVVSLLGEEESALFCEFYDITREGNFEEKCVLNAPLSFEEFAEAKQSSPGDLRVRFDQQKEVLWRAREKRVHPLKDDKILSSWNGLMIASLASAGKAFGEERYLQAALKAARFVEENMVEDGHLFRRWREGESQFVAGLDDYACLIKGYLALFEAGCGAEWLERAIVFTQVLASEFKGDEGAFFQTDGNDPNIIMRKCQFADGAEPSGNAIHAENLLKLYQITSYANYLDQAEDVFKASKVYLENYPPGYCYHVMNLLRYYDKLAPTVVIALDKDHSHKREIERLLFSEAHLHLTVVWIDPEDRQVEGLAPVLKTYKPLDNKTTLYLCRQGGCWKQTNNFNEMKKTLETLS